MTSLGSLSISWIPKILIDQRSSFNFWLSFGPGSVMLAKRLRDKNKTFRRVLKTILASRGRLVPESKILLRLSNAI